MTIIKKAPNQKAIFAFWLVLFFGFASAESPSPLQAIAIKNKIEAKNLQNHPHWKRLLHYRNGESEIDDQHFFLAANGKRDLKAELFASVTNLVNDKSDNKKSMMCYYPSRSLWIIEQFPELEPFIKKPQCTDLKKELEALSAKRVTLVLASAHINSPASAFGHTFLRIDASEDTTLASYSVNYAAQTTETNGLIYAYQGVFGGYKGLYSIVPYSKQLQTYSDLEQRDIWEYPLNLNKDEIKRLVYHVLEIRHFYADYFFASENCSYNLLWLLEVARADVNLINNFSTTAIPIDTLRTVIKENMVKDEVYRPSKRKEILALSKALTSAKALRFAKSSNYNFELLKGLSTIEKANAIELATQLLQVKYTKNKLQKKTYLKTFLRLLRERSKLGRIPENKFSPSISPQAGHKSNKFSFSVGQGGSLGLRFKVAYHDIYDLESGFISGSYISFFDTSIRYDKNKLTLDELNLIDIRSYSGQDPVFKPISWEVSLGGKRLFDNKMNAFLQAGAGLTLGNDSLFSYATLTPALYFSKDNKQSISANIGVISNTNKKLKVGMLAKKEWFKSNEQLFELESFATYGLSKNTSLKLSYKAKDLNGDKTKTPQLSMFWYY